MNTCELKKKVEEALKNINDGSRITLNELIYALRKESGDYSISDDIGGCIPSVKNSFVPSSWLSRRISKYELDESFDTETPVVLIDYYKEDLPSVIDEFTYRKLKHRYIIEDVSSRWEDYREDEPSDEDLERVAKKAEYILDRSEPYSEAFWECIEDAIRGYNHSDSHMYD